MDAIGKFLMMLLGGLGKGAKAAGTGFLEGMAGEMPGTRLPGLNLPDVMRDNPYIMDESGAMGGKSPFGNIGGNSFPIRPPQRQNPILELLGGSQPNPSRLGQIAGPTSMPTSPSLGGVSPGRSGLPPLDAGAPVPGKQPAAWEQVIQRLMNPQFLMPALGAAFAKDKTAYAGQLKDAATLRQQQGQFEQTMEDARARLEEQSRHNRSIEDIYRERDVTDRQQNVLRYAQFLANLDLDKRKQFLQGANSAIKAAKEAPTAEDGLDVLCSQLSLLTGDDEATRALIPMLAPQIWSGKDWTGWDLDAKGNIVKVPTAGRPLSEVVSHANFGQRQKEFAATEENRRYERGQDVQKNKAAQRKELADLIRLKQTILSKGNLQSVNLEGMDPQSAALAQAFMSQSGGKLDPTQVDDLLKEVDAQISVLKELLGK